MPRDRLWSHQPPVPARAPAPPPVPQGPFLSPKALKLVEDAPRRRLWRYTTDVAYDDACSSWFLSQCSALRPGDVIAFSAGLPDRRMARWARFATSGSMARSASKSGDTSRLAKETIEMQRPDDQKPHLRSGCLQRMPAAARLASFASPRMLRSTKCSTLCFSAGATRAASFGR